MTQIVAVILGFILTGLIGNRVVQQWQHRGWLRQQQFLGREKEYLALRDLSTELSTEIGRRIYQTRRLLWAIRSMPDASIDDRLKSYDESLTRWNENLGNYYVRLTLYASYYDTTDLERRIHDPFQAVGAELEAMVRVRRRGKQPDAAKIAKIDRRLNDLQGEIFVFNRDLLRIVENLRERIYFGRTVKYSKENLAVFSTWQLIKALFVSNVDTHSIIGAPSDLR